MELALQIFWTLSAVCFWAVMVNSNYRPVINFIKRKLGKKPEATPVEALVERLQDALKKAAAEAGANVQIVSDGGKIDFTNHRTKAKKEETQTLQWRKDGRMNEVKIIIDPALDTVISGSQEEFKELVKGVEASSLEGLLKEIAKPDNQKDLRQAQEFRFSPQSVEQMSSAGTSPAEVVSKLLKASGRMD